LVAALQQERVTRRKHDGQEPMSRRLPIEAVLAAAGTGIDDVDVIVSSFQAASPGGIGLVRPLVSPNFSLCDPGEARHLVASHHLAHALCTFGLSGFEKTAVLVCDLAGSTTLDGEDFLLPFSAYTAELAAMTVARPTRTECLSIYEIAAGGIVLRERQSIIPHNQPDVFVQGAASLYDNASRVVFGSDHAHGQLMALASLDLPEGMPPFPELLEVDGDDVAYRNDWQQQFGLGARFEAQIIFANRVQADMERALLTYARRARRLTGQSDLAVAGGVFLNIPSNSRISAEAGFRRYFVPSSPHDAGIAIGCAVAGWQHLIGETRPLLARSDDRLGPRYGREACRAAARMLGPMVTVREGTDPVEVARLLRDNHIIARAAGRSEFGPRALGGRSLLASPLSATAKDRLNTIKGRQEWRPVAPIVQAERISEFFTGPPASPYMSYAHTIRPEFREPLAALRHPDDSTRAQSLERDSDPFLYDVLGAFAELTGFPILVNTSLNGRSEPIVESPRQAAAFFRRQPDVDLLLLDDLLVERTGEASPPVLRTAPDTLLAVVRPRGTRRALLLRGADSMELSACAYQALSDTATITVKNFDVAVREELVAAFLDGFLVEATVPERPELPV
jgi:carbamoyltransferase